MAGNVIRVKKKCKDIGWYPVNLQYGEVQIPKNENLLMSYLGEIAD